jgi:hypothetical protein
MWLSIMIFFLIIWGFGYSLGYLLKLSYPNKCEQLLMEMGTGLGLFSVLAVLFSVITIPLDFRIFLVLALAIPLLNLIKKKMIISIPKITPSKLLDKSLLYIIIVLILSVVLFGVYLKGAFSYPYLENDDSWDHALGTKYIAIEKTAYQPENFNIHYLNPYPPSYDIILGLLHQINPSVSWVLKFFNSLIISLGIIFFYFFAERFTKNKDKALLATFILALLPSFMSHFIWAQSLALVLFFPAFYCFERINENPKWLYVAAIIVAAIYITQPTAALIFFIMALIFWAGKSFVSGIRQNLKILSAFILGGIISSLYWVPMLLIYGLQMALSQMGFKSGLFSDAKMDTSGGVLYSLRDFMVAPLQSKMDQPTGLGIFVFFILLVSITLIAMNYKKIIKKSYLLISVAWLIFTFLGVQGNAFPLKLFPHRFWAFFAIPVVLIAAEGIQIMLHSLKNRELRYTLLTLLVIGIIWTSGYPKYVVQTSFWPSGARWTSQEEIVAFVWLKDLPLNTPVFQYVPIHDSYIIGFDKYSCSWCPNVLEFRKTMINSSLDDVYSFLKSNNYEYLVISGMSFRYLARDFGENETQDHMASLLNELQNTSKFSLFKQNQGAIILAVN